MESNGTSRINGEDFETELTKKVLADLGGALPWEKRSYSSRYTTDDAYPAQPNSHRRAPYNPITNESYSGVTALTLSLNTRTYGEFDDDTSEYNNYAYDQRWLKSEDITRLGLTIRPHEIGTVVELVSKNNSERVKTIYFNAQQLEGLSRTPEHYQFPARLGLECAENLRLKDIKDSLEKKGVATKFSAQEPEQFVRELVRLAKNANEISPHTDSDSAKDRARAELRTEIATHLVSDRLGTNFTPHSPYFRSFPEYTKEARDLLRNDKNEIISAYCDAEKISNTILNLAPERDLRFDQYATKTAGYVYLNVNSEKEEEAKEAKAMGAWWHADDKKWIGIYEDREKLAKFMPKSEPLPEQKMTIVPTPTKEKIEEKKVAPVLPYKEKEGPTTAKVELQPESTTPKAHTEKYRGR